MSTNKITCSFTVDRDIYNAYKSIVVNVFENVIGNLIRYMLNVIKYETPNKTVEKAEITTITSEKTSDMNTLPDESIVPAARMMQAQSGRITLSKHSVNRIVLLP